MQKGKDDLTQRLFFAKIIYEIIQIIRSEYDDHWMSKGLEELLQTTKKFK